MPDFVDDVQKRIDGQESVLTSKFGPVYIAHNPLSPFPAFLLRPERPVTVLSHPLRGKRISLLRSEEHQIQGPRFCSPSGSNSYSLLNARHSILIMYIQLPYLLVG